MKKTLITLLALAGVASAALPEADTVLTLVANTGQGSTNGLTIADGVASITSGNAYVKWSEDIRQITSWQLTFDFHVNEDSISEQDLIIFGSSGVTLGINTNGSLEVWGTGVVGKNQDVNSEAGFISSVKTDTPVTLTYIANVADEDYVYYFGGEVGDYVNSGTLTVTVGDKSLTVQVEGNDLRLHNENSTTLKIWTNSAVNQYKNITLTQLAEVNYVPEPATATLSLLALCGLASRRRRK